MGIFDIFGGKKKNTVICKSSGQRKRESIEFLKELQIDYLESFPEIEDASEAKLKDVDVICKKAISTLLIVQVAHDALKDQFEKSKSMFTEAFERFGVENYLNAKEKAVWDGTYTKLDLIHITWEYEIFGVLVWALGIIDTDEIKIPKDPLDYMKAIDIVKDCKSYDDFKAKVNMRSLEEILDMLDLYYRYHWATHEYGLKHKGHYKINHEVVVERRRGLEWLVSNADNWFDIYLDT